MSVLYITALSLWFKGGGGADRFNVKVETNEGEAA